MKSIRTIVGTNIETRRKLLGMTQRDLAAAAKVSLTTIQHIEWGKVWVGSDTIEKIADALQCPVASLFSDPDVIPTADAKAIVMAVIERFELDIPEDIVRKAKLVRTQKEREPEPHQSIPKDILSRMQDLSKSDFSLLRRMLDSWLSKK